MSKIYYIFESYAISLLSGIFCVFLFSSIGFIFGLSINPVYSVFGLICSLLTLFFIQKRRNFSKSIILLSSLVFVSIIYFLIYQATNIMDVSWDGRTYHQTCIIFLKNGWNPVWQSAIAFAESHYSYNFIHSAMVWVQSYVKFSEIFAANIFSITNSVEAGKCINYFSMLILFCYSFASLGQDFFGRINIFSKFLLSSFFVFNPVVLQQMSTYYIDGLLYCYFILLLLVFINIEISEKVSKTSLFVLVSSSIIMANIKLGGLLYLILLTGIYSIYLFLAKRTNIFNQLKFFVILIFVAIILTGINPYITNVRDKHHIFHPIMGNEKINILKPNSTKQFIDKSPIYKFFYSTFSETANVSYNSNLKLKLKIPFSINLSELNPLSDADTRIGGFGVLWSGILILSFLLLLSSTFENKKEQNIAFLSIGIILLSVFFNPESWWARYIPQFWAFAVFSLLFVLVSKKSVYLKIITLFFILVIFANIVITFRINSNFNHKKREKLINILNTYDKAVSLYYPAGEMYEFSVLQKLDDYDFKYNFVNEAEYNKNPNSYEKLPFTIKEKAYWKSIERKETN